MTTAWVDWTARTPEQDREWRSGLCKSGVHAPGCDGYYPPGRDTYRCLCACHGPVSSSGTGP